MVKATREQHEELALKVSSNYIRNSSISDLESYIDEQHLDTLEDHLHRLVIGFKNMSPDRDHFSSFLDEYSGLTYDAGLVEKLALAKLASQLKHAN
ncbi:hypothetical protein [Enterococcus sp. CSURQ0835]|uniref:hypothetical protein n=1 Tax=Enterococcus sp. CSURQ0835 TaxID=2681394 RepID=UPI0013575213|nr:hypothetical protein [Enterococcus sp. CSURQ0835]